MNVLKRFITCWSHHYDETKYPKNFYFSLLREIGTINTAKELARVIKLLLHWKDGKIREDNKGNIIIGDMCYTKKEPKPNTYSKEHHGSILDSKNFYEWAQQIQHVNSFSVKKLSEIHEFQLWSENSIVLPSFILHVLNPRVFPIFDQHVNRTMRCFTEGANSITTERQASLTDNDYAKYQEFWSNILTDLEIHVDIADYSELKIVDEAIWAFGAFLKKLQQGKDSPSIGIKSPPQSKKTKGHGSKRVAYTLARNKEFKYDGSVKSGVTLNYSGKPFIKPTFFSKMRRYFAGKTIKGGFSMTDPPVCGLGYWVKNQSSNLNERNLTPRHAAHIAAIMVKEKYITYFLKGNTVYLTFPP